MEKKEEKERARVVSELPIETEGFRWIGLKKLEYVDEQGRQRQWESAERRTRHGEIDGVAILALIQSQSGTKVALVSQFRPPTNDYVLELPAGLVDEGETAEEAALRELKEECGLIGTSAFVSPIVWSDPGMSNANMRFVQVQVNGDDPANQNPVAEQEDGECIETHFVELDKLSQCLTQPDQWFNRHMQVDARLFAIALGLDLRQKL